MAPSATILLKFFGTGEQGQLASDLIKMDTSSLVFDNHNDSCFNRHNFRANTMIALCHTQSL